MTGRSLALVHLAMGAWGLAAYVGRAPAHVCARSAAFIFVALGLAGMLQGIDRFLMPLPAWRPPQRQNRLDPRLDRAPS